MSSSILQFSKCKSSLVRSTVKLYLELIVEGSTFCKLLVRHEVQGRAMGMAVVFHEASVVDH